MKRYSKPLGQLLDFKQEFFQMNDLCLEELKIMASIYRDQPRRVACKNCEYQLNFTECFTNFGVEYTFCSRCGHCNGAHDDTDTFADYLYRGNSYSRNYLSTDIEQYKSRVREIYLPKASFLKEALSEIGEAPNQLTLTDFGAGAGYFVSAAKECGFSYVTGYEVSETMVNFGSAMIRDGTGRDASLIRHDLADIVRLIEVSDAEVVSFIGVLEHLQEPRTVLKTISQNKRIRFVFLSVPIFSPTVILESLFSEIMPRHLVGGHTHLYTERSIHFFCNEFGLKCISEWWFGLDIADFSRSILISLQKKNTHNQPLQTYWNEHFMLLIDKLQSVLDQAKLCSEVHMVLAKDK